MITRLINSIAAHPVAAFVVVFAVFPFVAPYEALASQVLTYGLFALGFNVLYGYTGLLSFGHAAYWGLGAYGTGIALTKLGITSLWIGLGVGIGCAVLVGAIVGFFCLRRHGIYFAMLTLAFAQMLYFIAFHSTDLTGGDDGLRGIPRLPVKLPGIEISIDTPISFYYFAFVIVALMVALLKRILDSPFGAALQAVRENTSRMSACGYDVNRLKLLSFIFSALFTGVAGALEAVRLSFIGIDSMYWTTSAHVIIMTLLGGAGTFFGPFVGAATYMILEDQLSSWLDFWPIIIGTIFIGFVMFLPKGIWGTFVAALPKDKLHPPAPLPSTAGRAEDPAELKNNS